MTTQPQTFDEALAQWEEIAREAKRLTNLEMTLRKGLVAAAFPELKEGANTRELADGRKIKATGKINRSVDQAAVLAVVEKLREINDLPVSPDEVFKVKHELGISAFKKLSGRALEIASEAITAKDGAPTLEIV